MSATVTMETWILNASAKLGTIELLDHLNKGTVSLDCCWCGNEKIAKTSI